MASFSGLLHDGIDRQGNRQKENRNRKYIDTLGFKLAGTEKSQIKDEVLEKV